MNSKQEEFRDYCLELLSSMRQGEIASKKMFGGVSFSIDGKTFGIIAFDALWLKADDESLRTFLDAGCRIFTYVWNDGVARTMGYYTVPEEAMESAALMRPWAMLAWGAALRAAAVKTAKAKKPAKVFTASVPATKKVATKKTVAKKMATKTKQ